MIEKGNSEPRLGNVVKISKILGVELDTLFYTKEYLKEEKRQKRLFKSLEDCLNH